MKKLWIKTGVAFLCAYGTLLAESEFKYNTVIIGAGPTGLSAAYHLDKNALLIEQNDSVGGVCRSICDKGFTFDFAGHIIFSNDPYVQQLYHILLEDNIHYQNREAWIYSKNVYTRYPFQCFLYGLPLPIIQECLLGLIQAYIDLKVKEYRLSSFSCAGRLFKEGVHDCCADGSIEIPEKISSSCGMKPTISSSNYEEFIYKTWGKGIAQHFATPYNQKLWTVPLTDLLFLPSSEKI